MLQFRGEYESVKNFNRSQSLCMDRDREALRESKKVSLRNTRKREKCE